MVLECHRALTGMPPFVVAMEEGRYGLWRLRADDDDDDDISSMGSKCKVKLPVGADFLSYVRIGTTVAY